MDVAQEEIYLGLAPPYGEETGELPNLDEELSPKKLGYA